MHHAIGRIHGHDLALQHVSGSIARSDVKQGVPAPDVGPAELSRYDCHAVGLFHHGVIDRFLRGAGERIRLKPHKAKIIAGA